MVLIDGKATANQIKNEIAEEVKAIQSKGERAPHLAAVLVGNDGASLTYVGSKVRSCEKVGFDSSLIRLPEETTEAELLAKIAELNQDDTLDGYIVQLPLPKHIDEEKVLLAIDPKKDVDGFHPSSLAEWL